MWGDIMNRKIRHFSKIDGVQSARHILDIIIDYQLFNLYLNKVYRGFQLFHFTGSHNCICEIESVTSPY